MILIADSGSTKTDWTIIKGKKVIDKFTTMGFNPFFHSSQEIIEGLKKLDVVIKIKEEVAKIYYLGAGCSTAGNIKIVANGLSQVFENADLSIEHDLKGAAYATYNGKPAITGILGTGSNACYFDGKNVFEKTPSLGFIMGDEGGGGYFGKKLVIAHCYGWLPKEISQDFEEIYKLSIPELIRKVNSEPHANVFLASFMPFISKYKNHPYLHKMLVAGMTEYFENHILPFEESKNVEIHFVGSVAHHFSDSIHEAAEKLNLKIGQIIQKPSEGLVQYFLNYILK